MSQLFLCYSNLPPLDWARPGAIFVPDQHRENPHYQEIRARGGEVMPYLNMAESHIRGDLDREFRQFTANGTPPLWGNDRASWYPLTNIRVGQEYVQRCVDYIVQRFMPNFDGITLDVLGGQLWAKAGWSTWPAAERAAWQAGCVDFLRLLDAARRAVKPWFKITTVNIWHETKAGYAYIDGFYLESPTLGLSAFHRNLVAEQCGYLGQRRVFVIADTVTEAQAYAALPGVTHVTAVNVASGQSYKTAPPAAVPAVDRRLEETLAMRTWLQANRGDPVRVAQLESQLATAVAEREAAEAELVTAEAERQAAQAALGTVQGDLTAARGRLAEIATLAQA
jgi:hypothetical protein